MEFLFISIMGFVFSSPSNPPANPSDVISNPIWVPLSVIIPSIVSIISICVSIYVFRKQRSRKGIVCELISHAVILSAAEEVKKRVKFILDNKLPVNDLCLVLLKIWNSGNTAIKPADFRRPLKIDFGGAEVLEAEVLDTSSIGVKEEAKTSLRLNPRNVTLEPLLLNSKESINLKVLLTGHTSNSIQADTHIIEGGLQTRASVWETSKTSLIFWAIVFMIGGEILGFEVQWNLFPLLRYNPNPIIIAGLFFMSLFLKNLFSSVIGSYFWIKGYSTKFRTMRAVIIFWIVYSVVITLPLTLLVLLFALSGTL